MKTLIFILLVIMQAWSTAKLDYDSLVFEKWDLQKNEWKQPRFKTSYMDCKDIHFVAEAITPSKWVWDNDTIFYTKKNYETYNKIIIHTDTLDLPWWSNKIDTIKIALFLAHNFNRGFSTDTLIDTLIYVVPPNPLISNIESHNQHKPAFKTGKTFYYDIRGRKYNSFKNAPKGLVITSKGRKIVKLNNYQKY